MPEDILRQTWLRYFGYAKEICFGLQRLCPGLASPGVARASYQVVFFYVLLDAFDKSLKKFSKDACPLSVVVAAGDALIWQSLASVALPGMLLSKLRYVTREAVNTYPLLTRRIPPKMRGTVVAGLGLLAIPAVVGPIDFGVDSFMNYTYRLLLGH